MMIDERLLKPEEKAAFRLRALYDANGYCQYKMSKFEEYELYVRNKEFLISDNIITFTDTNGKLMALKPDVTLSIIRSTKDQAATVKKVYYTESVYRVSKGTRRFQELLQTGLECIGAIENKEIVEVLSLAAQSLRLISPNSVLDLSHLGILQDLIAEAGLSPEEASAAIRFAGEKNIHELASLLRDAGAKPRISEIMTSLVQLYGPPQAIIPLLDPLLAGTAAANALTAFKEMLGLLRNCPAYDNIRIDFSVVSDMRYYNGVAFKGFIAGIPGSILSGGQYDALMRRMRRTDRAIGFAVYLDALERLEEGETQNG